MFGRKISSPSVLLSALLVACGGASPGKLADDDAKSNVAKRSESIVNGSILNFTKGPPRINGAVVNFANGSCTGTLVTNQIAISAAHCNFGIGDRVSTEVQREPHVWDQNYEYRHSVVAIRDRVDWPSMKAYIAEHDIRMEEVAHLDMRLVHFWPPIPGDKATPVMPNWHTPPDGKNSGLFRIAGFGQTGFANESPATEFRRFNDFDHGNRRQSAKFWFYTWDELSSYSGIGQGDSGGPIFQMLANPHQEGLFFPNVVGVTSSKGHGTWDFGDFDNDLGFGATWASVWGDLTLPLSREWFFANTVNDTARILEDVPDGYGRRRWLGEPDYRGWIFQRCDLPGHGTDPLCFCNKQNDPNCEFSCDRVRDPDCDGFYDEPGHDNCPGFFNSDQLSTDNVAPDGDFNVDHTEYRTIKGSDLDSDGVAE